MLTTLENARTLVLNGDMLPLSWNPLSVWSWQDAISSVHKGKANVLATYKDLTVSSPSIRMAVPSVIMLTNYVHAKYRVRFTRYNIYLRDKFICAYCDVKHPPELLSFDHVIPRAKGGKTSWDNIVTSCIKCNQLKNDKSLGDITFPKEHAKAGQKLRLHYHPYEPTPEQFRRSGRVDKNNLHESWQDYLYWDTELED